jgi:hypothetical protein
MVPLPSLTTHFLEYKTRSLYGYQGQRPEDLSFGENVIISAHPSKTGGDWWYGTVVSDGKSGFFPQTYVSRVESGKAFSSLNTAITPSHF